MTNLEFVASHDWHRRGFNYKQVKPQPTKLKSKLQQLKPQRQMLQPLTILGIFGRKLREETVQSRN